MATFDQCFLFFDNPHGGVEDIEYLVHNAPWVKGVFLGINKPYTWEQWHNETQVVRECKRLGLFYGPWARTGHPPPEGTGFEPEIVDELVDIMSGEGLPGIVNGEVEIDFNQPALDYIVTECVGLDWALSTLARPMHSLHYTGVKIVLPQIMPADQQIPSYDPKNVEAIRDEWHAFGVSCAYMTYGAYSWMNPTTFILNAPYSIFPGDPLMATRTVEQWAPIAATYHGCKKGEAVLPVGVVKSAMEAYASILNSSSAKNWREQNPGELDKVQKYAASAPGTAPPTGVTTEFGKGLISLIDARKYADGTHK